MSKVQNYGTERVSLGLKKSLKVIFPYAWNKLLDQFKSVWFIITYLIILSSNLYFPKKSITEQIAIIIIVHISVVKRPLVNDEAKPAVTIVTAV